jgi:acyl transferase domain-containing protein
MVGYALARTLLDDGIRPNYLLAEGLGVYAAAAAAAALDPTAILTVSPVPLMSTFAASDCVAANEFSRAPDAASLIRFIRR